MTEAKPFEISKEIVWEAYQRVKKNDGASGVDGQEIKDFEERLKDNLYKIWNRMSSGSYMPEAVRVVGIPKENGKTRELGIPTVADRIAQMIVKIYLEGRLEEVFHKSSYGYRAGKSAHEAIGEARKNCWKYDWLIDLDIKGFFDNIDHELMMKAVQKHVKEKWILLYIERWLKAPAEKEGKRTPREKGTPQGGVISPLLANLFLHYAFDKWIEKKYPETPFERYADDIVVHCKSEPEAEEIKAAIKERLEECKLEINEEKTKIVYCKDSNRKGGGKHIKFDFLGHTFKPRMAKSREGKIFVSFTPAVSDKAQKTMRQETRNWKLSRRTNKTLEEIAEEINPKIRGWINYYGKFHKSAMYPIYRQIDQSLIKWAKRKFKNLRNSWQKARKWLKEIAKREANMLAIWKPGIMPEAGW